MTQGRWSIEQDDFQVQITGAKLVGADAPVWTDWKGSQVLAFKKNAINTIAFSVQLTHAYKEGSNVEFHIHLAYPTNGTGNSVWQMTHSWANINTAFPTATTPTAVTLAAPAVLDQHTVNQVATLTGTGKTISSVILCSLSRLGTDAADTYNDFIYLVAADFHIVRDTIGSISEYTK